MSKYKIFRIPEEAYWGLREKQQKIATNLIKITKKPIKVPLTKVMIACTTNQVDISDKYMLELFTKQGRRKKQ